MQNENGNDLYSFNYYPERKNSSNRKSMDFIHIDHKLNSTYKEIIKAFNHGLFIVCAMGIRALLEGICFTEGIDDKKAFGLEKKIKTLKEISNIPDSIIEGLMSIKFIGDYAAHRLEQTSKEELGLAIDVLEALLTNLYEAKFDLERKAKKLKFIQDKQGKKK